MSAPITGPAKTPQEVLRAAADRLARFGWIQGESIDLAGRCCLAGALGTVPKSGNVLAEAFVQLERDLGLRFRTTDLIHWNDAPDRTADEVIAQLRATADRLDREQAAS